MLLELRVENLLLIERAELRLAGGLNVITGETGAGKTVLAHSLDLLLGGKARPGVVRPGCEEAWVEGVFSDVGGALDAPELADLRERIGAGEEIVLARRVGADGRTRAFVQGRGASAADLRELGGRLISFYGQHEHRRLTIAAAQLEILDGYCGPVQLALRQRMAAEHGRVLRLERELAGLRDRAGSRERDRDLLAFELGEIEDLEPSAAEQDLLRAERSRLRGFDVLREAVGAAAEALVSEGSEEGGAIALLAAGEGGMEAAGEIDERLASLTTRLRAVRLEAEDLGAELRDYLSDLQGDPERLEEVEQRLERYDRLERKHGGSVEAVLAYAAQSREQLALIDGGSEALERLDGELRGAIESSDEIAAALGKARAKAAPRLAEQVVTELAQLAMEDANFEVSVQPREQRGAGGDERVEFLLAPNPGVAATPLRDTASGGELSRSMLAIMGVAAAGGEETLVFDEVDAGIGGRTARAVGERLQRLAAGRQLLCITHLPQIASLAERHFLIAKSAQDELVHTTVTQLGAEQLEGELVRMLGADGDDAAARKHAQGLLRAA
ncbi:MAG: DNA repair protein RecN [Thermoleophilaceae bacterium]|nr:DNA repair protein RecN [Thermoleophilaceae bacterium]